MIKRSDLFTIALVVVLFWFIMSMGISFEKSDRGKCGKRYPIGYIFYGNFFCEIEAGDMQVDGVKP